jgi:hypothetical protein
MIPHVIVLEPGLVVFKIYNGYWFFGRPTIEELRHDLRAVLKKCRPDWDITKPELKALGNGVNMIAFILWQDLRAGVSGARVEEVDGVEVRSIRNSNQFQIVRRKDFPFRVVYLHSKGLSGAFVQNLKTFLAAGEEITFSPLTQSNDDREQLSAFGG